MRSKTQKVVWISLSLVSVCAILFALVVGYHNLELGVRVLLAREQVKIFGYMREEARAGDTERAIDCLEYTLNYYFSGTKQVESSALDEIVETSRRLAIEDIITLLRQKSGRDFGTDPKAWIGNRAILLQKQEGAAPSFGEASVSPK